LARVYPIGALTKARAGVELAPYHVLADAGASRSATMERPFATRSCCATAPVTRSDLNAIFISHCEDADLKSDAVMNEGRPSARLGLPGSPG